MHTFTSNAVHGLQHLRSRDEMGVYVLGSVYKKGQVTGQRVCHPRASALWRRLGALHRLLRSTHARGGQCVGFEDTDSPTAHLPSDTSLKTQHAIGYSQPAPSSAAPSLPLPLPPPRSDGPSPLAPPSIPPLPAHSRAYWRQAERQPPTLQRDLRQVVRRRHGSRRRARWQAGDGRRDGGVGQRGGLVWRVGGRGGRVRGWRGRHGA